MLEMRVDVWGFDWALCGPNLLQKTPIYL